MLSFDVVGADGPKRYFGSLTPQTIAHAYLFSGPSGVGKKTFARRLAQSLLCRAEKPSVLGYDGTCSSCALFAGPQARHPDFLEHAGVLKIGDRDAAAFHEEDGLSARDLVRQLSMQSYSGGMRVLLLGDVDFATHHAANALLKFLEEPPSGVVMILTSAAPGRLLPTIHSRLIDVRFPPLSREQVREILRRLNYNEKDAELGAALSGGSVSRAVAALAVEEESLRVSVAGWFFASVSGKTPQESWATRETLDEGLEIVKTLVRDWISCNASGGAKLVSLDYADRLRRLRPLEGADAVAILERLDEAQRLARTNVSPAMVSEFVRIAITSSG
jgi:DNA polymerase-3 subunit delta'